MLGMFTFAADVGAALAYLIPTLCFVTGTWVIFSGIMGMVKRSSKEQGFLAQGLVPELMIVGGLLLLNFTGLLNAGSRSFGFSANAGIGTGGTEKYSFDAQAMQAALAQGPAATLTAFLDQFHLWLFCVGALGVYTAIVRILGRARGTNNTSAGGNLAMMISSFILMNAETVLPVVAKELGLT